MSQSTLSRLLLTASLSLTVAFVARADGHYVAQAPVPTSGFAMSNADQSLPGLPNERGAQPVSLPTSGTRAEISATRIFQWMPDGPLKDNPAPTVEALQTSTVLDGPVKSILTGSGSVSTYADFFVKDFATRLASAFPYTDNTPAYPSPSITSSPTQPYVTPIPSGQIKLNPVTGELIVTGWVGASSQSYITANPGARGTSQFNQIKIKISDITLKP